MLEAILENLTSVGIALAIYDFQNNVKMKNNVAYAPVGGGDDEDGI